MLDSFARFPITVMQGRKIKTRARVLLWRHNRHEPVQGKEHQLSALAYHMTGESSYNTDYDVMHTLFWDHKNLNDFLAR